MNGATCVDRVNAYNCNCNPDWTDTHCELCKQARSQMKVCTQTMELQGHEIFLAMEVFLLSETYTADLDLNVRVGLSVHGQS